VNYVSTDSEGLGFVNEVIGVGTAVFNAVSGVVGAAGGAEAGRIAAEAMAEEAAAGHAAVIGGLFSEKEAAEAEAAVQQSRIEAEASAREATSRIGAELRAEERRLRERTAQIQAETERIRRLRRIEELRRQVPGWVWAMIAVGGIGLVFSSAALVARRLD
jgi:hypothetical protein